MPEFTTDSQIIERLRLETIEAYRNGNSNENYLSSHHVSIDTWEVMMNEACDGGYNAFVPSAVAAALRLVGSLSAQPAREGSVAVYIHGESATLANLARTIAEEKARLSTAIQRPPPDDIMRMSEDQRRAWQARL